MNTQPHHAGTWDERGGVPARGGSGSSRPQSPAPEPAAARRPFADSPADHRYFRLSEESFGIPPEGFF